jgi:hypothetical protein
MQMTSSAPTSAATKPAYPKPPYDDCEEVYHEYDTLINPRCAFRAMEKDGRIFKQITQKVEGLRYVYWHPDRNSIELWHEKGNVEAWVAGIRLLDERFLFATLRSPLIKPNQPPTVVGDVDAVVEPSAAAAAAAEAPVAATPSSTFTDGGDGSVVEIESVPAAAASPELELEFEWGQQRLSEFKAGSDYKMLFDIPDLTGCAPAWLLTPAVADALDGVLYSYHLPRGETVLYDTQSCALVWLRRDCSSYEIRTNSHEALQFAQQFILHTLCETLNSGQIDSQLQPSNAMYWTNAYHQMRRVQRQQQQQHQRQRHPYKKALKQKHPKATNELSSRAHKKKKNRSPTNVVAVE